MHVRPMKIDSSRARNLLSAIPRLYSLRDSYEELL